jgi:CHAD domain-containing protein
MHVALNKMASERFNIICLLSGSRSASGRITKIKRSRAGSQLRPSTMEDVVKTSPATPADRLDRLALEARGALRSADAGQVHQLRVAIRRFSQALDVSGIDKGRRRLKKVMSLAGYVRDFDITADLIARMSPPARLKAALARKRKKAEVRLLESLSPLVAKVSKWKANWPAGAPTSTAGPTLGKTAAEFLARGTKAGGSAEDLHRLRLAAKKLRYTLELASPDHPRLVQIKELQTRLGSISDCETARKIVSKAGGGKQIVFRIKDRQKKRTRRFRRYWDAHFSDLSAWKRDLKAAGVTRPRPGQA